MGSHLFTCILFCEYHVNLPHLKGWSVRTMSNIKPISGAGKVGNCCSNVHLALESKRFQYRTHNESRSD